MSGFATSGRVDGPYYRKEDEGKPMTVEQLVCLYEEGALTAHHMILELLRHVDPLNVDDMMCGLPSKFYPELESFLGRYRVGRMITIGGETPSPESVEAAKQWLASHGSSSGA